MRFSGSALYIEFGGTDLSTGYRSIAWDEETRLIDQTKGLDTEESHVVATESTTFSLSVLWDQVPTPAGGTPVYSVLLNGTSGTLVIGPLGTAGGQPKWSCIATVVATSHTIRFDRAIGFDVDLVRNGGWVDNFQDPAKISTF